MKSIKITYDKKADALYIHLQDGEFAANKEVEEGIILDLGQKNELLGVEVLAASTRISPLKLSQFSMV